MSEDEPEAGALELRQASKRQKRHVLAAIGALLVFAAAAFIFFRLYSAPRERKKKIRMLTQNAWSWYVQLSQCLGGIGTPPGQPTEIYDRTLEKFEDDPQFVVGAKQCGHAEDIVKSLNELTAARPNQAVRSVVEPLVVESQKLHNAVIQIVGMALEGPVKGEDSSALYGSLWKVAIGFEKLFGLVGMKSPLEPIAQIGEAGAPPPHEAGTAGSPPAVTIDVPSLGDPAKLKSGPVPSQGGVLALGFEGEPGAAALLWPAGGSTAEVADLRPLGTAGPYLVDESKGLPSVEVSIASEKGVTLKRVVGAPAPTATLAGPGRTPLALLRVDGRAVAAVRGPGNAIAVTSGGKETTIVEGGDFLALGNDGKKVVVVYRELEAKGGRHKVKMRISDDAGASFGAGLLTTMEAVNGDVATPACVAGPHIWFGANETAFHSSDSGKTFKKLVVYSPKGGGNLTLIRCTADGGMASLFLPRNLNRRGLWVAGCGVDCRAFGEPFPVTTRAAEQVSLALSGKSVLVVWSEARRVRGRRAPSMANLTVWEPSRPVAGPADFPSAKDALLGVSAHADDADVVIGWFGKEHALRVLGSKDGGKTWGPP